LEADPALPIIKQTKQQVGKGSGRQLINPSTN
jgi:hypothetical protein